MTPAQAADWAAYLDEHRAELLELFERKFPELAAAIARAEAGPCGPGCRCAARNATQSAEPCQDTGQQLPAAQRPAPGRAGARETDYRPATQTGDRR